MVQKKSKASLKKTDISVQKQGLSTTKVAIIVAIIGLFAIILGSIIGIIPNICKTTPPEFYLVKGVVYHPDSIIIVKAMNSPAKKEKPIIFDIDGYCFHQAANGIKKDKEIFWHIDLKHLGLPDDVCNDGEHSVCFGFTQNKMSQRRKICFDSKPPQAVVGYIGETPAEKRIFGKVVDDNPDQNISVEVAFRHQENLKSTQLPVKSYVNANGRKMYEFEYHVQNIPQIPKNDPNYNILLILSLIRKIYDSSKNPSHLQCSSRSGLAMALGRGLCRNAFDLSKCRATAS